MQRGVQLLYPAGELSENKFNICTNPLAIPLWILSSN